MRKNLVTRLFFLPVSRLVLLLLILTSSRIAIGQNYPVQVTTSLLPPYSPELSYYTSADVNNLQVFVNLLDIETIDLRTKLRITIEGAGVTMTTSPSYVPQALVLQGGVPEILSGFDLRNYLNPDNMIFEGMTRAEFIRTGQFPEGFYTFTIEVLDYNRSVQVSNASMATAWIVLNDPPLINFPFNGDKLLTSEPQIINFSWLGRHLASPNSAFSTEYEFTLYEMYPGQTNPEVAVRSSNSVFRTTTNQSALFYGPADPALIPGKSYAFRIRAYDISGRDLFKNEGYSETYWFQYGDACLGLSGVSGEPVGDDRLKITWEPDYSHTGFEIHYRQTGKTNWMIESTLSTSQVLPDLQPNTEYEYKVVGKCQQYYGQESTIKTLTTEAGTSSEEDEEFACGTESPIGDLSEVPLDRELLPYDEFHIGGMDVAILTVIANPDGTYSGTGYYTASRVFNGAGIKVDIKNVLINEDYHAIAGRVVSVYNPSGPFMLDLDKVADKVADLIGDSTDDIEVVSVSEPIAAVTVTDGVIVLTNADGEVIPLPEGADGEPISLPAAGEFLAIEDSEGEGWTIDSAGNVSKGLPDLGGSGADAPNAISAEETIDFIVNFVPSATQTYGFDDPTIDGQTQNSASSYYTKAQIQEEDYWVAHKSVATGFIDAVEVTSTEATFPDYIGFKIGESGLAAQPSQTDNNKQLNLTGKYNNNEETLIAYARQEDGEGNINEITLGQLTVTTYDKVREKVVIVPVNDASAPSAYTLDKELNRIYGPAVAEWEVVIASNYQVDSETISGLTEGESSVISSFPSNMGDFNKAYKRSDGVTLDKDAYYLFMIPGNGDGRSGFMPFKRQFGYIWTGQTSKSAQTIAHELGHGAFRLRHTFSSEAFVAGQGTTKNLMDYNDGDLLYKHQWDLVHDPESMVGWFEEDEESASYDPTYNDIWVNNLLTMACVKSKGENQSEIEVAYSVSQSELTYGNRGGIRFDLNDVEVTINVDDLPSVNTYTVDLSSKSVNSISGLSTVSYSLSGSDKKLSFSVADSESSNLLSLLDSPTESLFQQLVDEIPSSEGDEAYSALSRLPDCAYELISATDRMKYIDWMVNGEWVTNDHQEELIIRLMEEIKEGDVPSFITSLESYSDWEGLFENFDNIATHQGLFRAVMKLYEVSTTKEEREDVQAVFDFNMLNHTSALLTYISVVEVSYSSKELNFTRSISTASWTPYGFQNVVETSTSHANTSLFDPVMVIINDDHKNLGLQEGTELKSVPAILAAFFIEKKNSETNKQLASTGLDIALLAVGVGEVSAAIKAYQAVRTIRTLFRLTLAVADFATAYTDLACQSDDSELCNEWKEVSFYIQIGLLSLNAADGIESLISRTNNIASTAGSKLDLVTLEAKKLISNAASEVKSVETDLIGLSNKTGGKMEGLEYALKTEESLVRKMLDRTSDTEISKLGLSKAIEKTSAKMNDVMRFTITFEPSKYVDNYFEVLRALEVKGYKKIQGVSFNAWFKGNGSYKGLNTTFETPSGQQFEFQFHTTETFKLKTDNHGLYEVARDVDVSKEAQLIANEKMIESYKTIETPIGIERIKNE